MKLRPEEAIYIPARCACGWKGHAEIVEGEWAYPCPYCGEELERDK